MRTIRIFSPLLFFCVISFIIYTCNTNADNNVNAAANKKQYASASAPNCPALVQINTSAEIVDAPQENIIETLCYPAELAKDTLYFHKDGGFDCLALNKGFNGTALNYENDQNDQAECKRILPNYSFIEDGVWKTVQNDYCKNNYCYVDESRIISPSDETCENNHCPANMVVYSFQRDASAVPTTKIECSWHSVAYASSKSLLVSVNKNETGEKRSVFVPLQTAQHACESDVVGFTIIQSAE